MTGRAVASRCSERMIRREIRTEDNTRMVNKFIDDLSEVSK